ncbi:hypothetical protein [Pseudoneobacillus rhizosphaerae]|jgi:hypothetical protein|uniref:Uncharacterized protein n=1 Tax=Pseudoneobacillus rhizosphaerae TaxID=2880968 RepID=A0A9C7G816_9BACI|nr:hypothetical protein [Pseudoneobacillus rhizosphaerae]CAG9607252.1 hypothetical protein NEOCIP111885_00942 [Pseudoneobacillus rhizosphaerae]
MNSEAYLDFCFVREARGGFAVEIEALMESVFQGIRVNWYLEEKSAEGADIVVAEVKGMAPWKTEEETLHYLEEHAGEAFWEYLQGYQMYIYPNNPKGCGSCGTH